MEAIIPPPQATFDSQQAPVPEPIQPSSNLGKKILIVCAVLIFGVVAGVVGYLMGGTNTPPAEVTGEKQIFETSLNDGAVVEDSEELQQSEQSGTTRFAFIRDHAVWISEGGTSRQVSKDGQAVESIAFDARTNTVAYTWGKPENNGYGTYTYPHTVTLVELASQISFDIYHEDLQKGSEIGNGEYLLKVRGALFSRDGQSLALTTSDGIYMYDRATKSTTMVWTNRSNPSDWKSIPPADKGQLYGFRPVAFSPNKKFLLAESVYYEWTKPLIVDLENKTFVAIDATLTNREMTAFDWKSDTELLFVKYEIVNMGMDDENTASSVMVYDLGSKEQRELSKHMGQVAAQIVIGKVLYYTVSSRDSEVYTNTIESVNLTDFTKKSLRTEKSLVKELMDSRVAALRQGGSPSSLLINSVKQNVGGPSAIKSISELNLSTMQEEVLEENASF